MDQGNNLDLQDHVKLEIRHLPYGFAWKRGKFSLSVVIQPVKFMMRRPVKRVLSLRTIKLLGDAFS